MDDLPILLPLFREDIIRPAAFAATLEIPALDDASEQRRSERWRHLRQLDDIFPRNLAEGARILQDELHLARIIPAAALSRLQALDAEGRKPRLHFIEHRDRPRDLHPAAREENATELGFSLAITVLEIDLVRRVLVSKTY